MAKSSSKAQTGTTLRFQPKPKPKPRPPRSRKGIPNRRYRQVTRSDSRCPDCHSSQRTKFYRKVSYDSNGEIDGIPFNRVVMRYCTCTKCQKPRCEVTHELW